METTVLSVQKFSVQMRNYLVQTELVVVKTSNLEDCFASFGRFVLFGQDLAFERTVRLERKCILESRAIREMSGPLSDVCFAAGEKCGPTACSACSEDETWGSWESTNGKTGRSFPCFREAVPGTVQRVEVRRVPASKDFPRNSARRRLSARKFYRGSRKAGKQAGKRERNRRAHPIRRRSNDFCLDRADVQIR